MAQFAKDAVATPESAVRTKTPGRRGQVPVADTVTHEGGRGFERTPEGELFVLGASYLYGKDTFYERPSDRDRRFLDLLAQVDPTWLAGFIPYLRRTLYIRTAAIVAAAEYVRLGYPNGRQVVRGAVARLDEPAELVGYWHSRYGKRLPMALKRGLADALTGLTSEYSAAKYAGWGNRVALADAIQLAHPEPRDEAQSTLFSYLLAKRRGVPGVTPRGLPLHEARAELLAYPDVADRREILTSPSPEGAELIARAGLTWEWVASTLLPGGMGQEEWSAVIPSMGAMALLRNLRNFEQKGLTAKAEAEVLAKLSDQDYVRRSRALPLRFLQAYQATSRVKWHPALEAGLRHATANVPELDGKTAALADVSGSMTWGGYDSRDAGHWPTAVAFADIVADRSGSGSTLHVYSSSMDELPVGDVLPTLTRARAARSFGGGTNTVQAILTAYHRTPDAARVVVVTDEQAFEQGGYYWSQLAAIPVPIYTWNVEGYRAGHLPSGGGNRYSFGGLSDGAFTMLAALEGARDAGWPWEHEPVSS